MVIVYGDQEVQKESIEKMSYTAFNTNRVKILKGENKGHCSPLFSFLTEETQDEKEHSCFVFAGLIPGMLLFQTSAYRDPAQSHEPMNLLTINDNHL